MGNKCLSCSADLPATASFPWGISPPVAAKGAELLSLQPSMSKEPVLSPYFAVAQSGLLTFVVRESCCKEQIVKTSA